MITIFNNIPELRATPPSTDIMDILKSKFVLNSKFALLVSQLSDILAHYRAQDVEDLFDSINACLEVFKNRFPERS